MIRTTTLLCVLAMCAACETIPPADPDGAAGAAPDADPPSGMIEAARLDDADPAEVRLVETITPLLLPGQLKAMPTASRTRPGLTPIGSVSQGRADALIEPSKDGYLNAIQIYPYVEGALYRLYASPGQVSDIALQAGETLISVSAGDTVRWVVGDTRSGTGATERAHILVKPVSAGLRTNLMLATDRRTYHLELESIDEAYMAALSWRYPHDEIAALTAPASPRPAQIADARMPPATDLNFEYRITGDRPAWRPRRVYDDGRQVFIEMPESVATSDLPPLFILSTEDKPSLVNYRVHENVYIVDRLFEQAELRLGERDQTVVRITKGGKPTGLAALFGG